eukprot:6183394-Pleurochrysis_carterae.AAC.6
MTDDGTSTLRLEMVPLVPPGMTSLYSGVLFGPGTSAQARTWAEELTRTETLTGPERGGGGREIRKEGGARWLHSHRSRHVEQQTCEMQTISRVGNESTGSFVLSFMSSACRHIPGRSCHGGNGGCSKALLLCAETAAMMRPKGASAWAVALASRPAAHPVCWHWLAEDRAELGSASSHRLVHVHLNSKRLPRQPAMQQSMNESQSEQQKRGNAASV